MHESSFQKAVALRQGYLAGLEATPLKVLDIGSAVVADGHPSNRQVMANPAWTYTGLDIEAGSNVDLVVAEPYDWAEVPDASVDVVTCSQVFEHTSFFWLTIQEIGRVLKPRGVLFLIAPGGGPLHRYPVDCWRFYDDGFPALAEWASLSVVEARVQWLPVYPKGNMWRDAAAVLQRPERTPDEELAIARRYALAKASLVGEHVLARAPVAAPEPSAIPVLADRGILAAEERRLAESRGTLALKLDLVGKHLRSIRKALTLPLDRQADA